MRGERPAKTIGGKRGTRLALAAWRPCAALASALLVWAALPADGFWLLGCVAYVPLAFALRGLAPGRAALHGLLCGVALQLLMTDGLRIAIRDLFGFSAPLAAALHFACCVFEGGRVALLAWLQVRLSARVALPHAFLLALLASEVLWPAIFPVPLAVVATQAPFLLQLAEIGGEVAVSATLGAANAASIALVLAGLRDRARGGFMPWREPLGYAAVLGLSTLYGVSRISDLDADTPAGEPLSVAIVQANAADREPWAALAHYVQMTQALKAQGAPDLVLWSETVVSRALDERIAASFLEPRFIRPLSVPLVFGAALLQHGAERETFLNSALLSDASGHIVGRYDKRVLVPFAEYVPFARRWPSVRELLPRISEFAAGAREPLLQLGRIEFAALICYEVIWPDTVREALRSGRPAFIVNLTNDRWFGRSKAPELHLALAVLRAVEHRRHVLRGADSGISAVIDPAGRIVARADLFREASVRARVSPRHERTPFSRIGNHPWRLLSLVILVVACWPWRARRREHIPAYSRTGG